MCQQSPSFGKSPTGATSAHHFVTPTSDRFAPMAHKMDVALGASETIRSAFFSFPLIVLAREYQRRPRKTPDVSIDSPALV
jgi:hypothetical protein